jgi:hypothetical protein
MKWLVMLALLVACSGSNEMKHEQLGPLTFDVPVEWDRADFEQRGQQIAQWTPSENGRSESLVVVRYELSPQVAGADEAYLSSLLAQAQLSLPKARMSSVKHVTTKRGISGVQLAVDFLPPGHTETYHRIHVVLVEDKTLVSVIYTAKQPDPSTLELMLATLHHEEG